MSLEHSNAFIEHVQKNEDLRLEIEAVGQDIPALLAIAQREGYEVTESEFVTAVRQRGYDIEELQDADLESVVGGQALATQANTCGSGCKSTNWPDC